MIHAITQSGHEPPVLLPLISAFDEIRLPRAAPGHAAGYCPLISFYFSILSGAWCFRRAEGESLRYLTLGGRFIRSARQAEDTTVGYLF